MGRAIWCDIPFAEKLRNVDVRDSESLIHYEDLCPSPVIGWSGAAHEWLERWSAAGAI